MAKLTAATRNALPSSVFALPGRRYPVNDRAHAIAANAYASRYATPAQRRVIDAKANRMLHGGMSSKSMPRPKSVIGMGMVR